MAVRESVLKSVAIQHQQMAEVGYFSGVLLTMWAEVAVEQAQDHDSFRLFWEMKNRLGWLEN